MMMIMIMMMMMMMMMMSRVWNVTWVVLLVSASYIPSLRNSIKYPKYLELEKNKQTNNNNSNNK